MFKKRKENHIYKCCEKVECVSLILLKMLHSTVATTTLCCLLSQQKHAAEKLNTTFLKTESGDLIA